MILFRVPYPKGKNGTLLLRLRGPSVCLSPGCISWTVIAKPVKFSQMMYFFITTNIKNRIKLIYKWGSHTTNVMFFAIMVRNPSCASPTRTWPVFYLYTYYARRHSQARLSHPKLLYCIVITKRIFQTAIVNKQSINNLQNNIIFYLMNLIT